MNKKKVIPVLNRYIYNSVIKLYYVFRDVEQLLITRGPTGVDKEALLGPELALCLLHTLITRYGTQGCGSVPVFRRLTSPMCSSLFTILIKGFLFLFLTDIIFTFSFILFEGFNLWVCVLLQKNMERDRISFNFLHPNSPSVSGSRRAAFQ